VRATGLLTVASETSKLSNLLVIDIADDTSASTHSLHGHAFIYEQSVAKMRGTNPQCIE